MSESSIYREALLKHIRHPKNVGSIDNPDLKASVYNPLCGDELELNIVLSEGKIQECKTKVRGCSLCQVSASMMSELILLKTLKDAVNMRKNFLKSLKKDYNKIPKNLEYLRPLISLKRHKSRIKCMSLAWDALDDCVRQNEKQLW